jgi:DNA-binding transcriptional ArsR family regulator
VADTGLTEVFFALGDDTRLEVIARLRTAGALSATVLSDGAAISRQAIVKHLHVLEHAGLVRHERQGREVLYAFQGRRVDEARAFLEAISAGWDRAIERLRGMVEAPPPHRSQKKKKPRARSQTRRKSFQHEEQ